MPDHAPVEITVFTKSGGPLTKRISITDDREIKSDGSACVMTEGEARRAPLADVAALGRLIEGLKSSQAIALGALRPDLPERVRVVTKRKLNGQANTIARTGGHISYGPGQPAWSLCDYDKKGMPAEVAIAVQQYGNYWSALCTVLPALKNVAHVLRRSTSAGLICGEAKLPGSGGQHGFVAVCDGTDIERFLRVLHERCWLAGYGWHMVGAGGQLLDRSIVDRMVGAPERLVFEGPPVLVPPLEQDAASRRPVAIAGNLLDTLASCPPLTVAETAALRELKARSAHRLAGDYIVAELTDERNPPRIQVSGFQVKVTNPPAPLEGLPTIRYMKDYLKDIVQIEGKRLQVREERAWASAFGTGSMTWSTLSGSSWSSVLTGTTTRSLTKTPSGVCSGVAVVCCRRARRSAAAGGGSGGAVDPPTPATASTPPVDENSAAS
jgi:hypothetical protein